MNPTAGLHPRLRTAFSVLGYCKSVSTGRSHRGGVGRDLIAGEVAARNSALELLRHYMTGEVIIDSAPVEIANLVAFAAGPAAKPAEADTGPDSAS